ncbi:Erf family protein [Lactobacillus pentosus] [Lactiplantibacillus mudanjiangensis]|uniref:ERF family protein n=1 Tax=Lactiplantibacillus mudanjiangensis TaxID=1296538 RepID=UPI0010154E42|nr:ERF family protein [Lactiplantibacillus mudanjiangensis]VDG31495.1 Erf family protein [Lactobacillus pentosus] [Lactiplantibacillus mudanjiangensis]
MAEDNAEKKEKAKASTGVGTGSIYERLQRIHRQVKYIQKSQQASQYTYAGSSDVLGQIHGLMDDEKLLLLPRIVSHHVTSSATKKGSLAYFTELEMTMTWVNTDNPGDKIESTWYAQGVDIAGEKGVGKALTYGEKYFLLKFFNIATDNADPDAFQQNIESKKQSEPISSEQRKTLVDLFDLMAGVTQIAAEKVKIGYLNTVGVSDMTQLNHDSAHKLIELVQRQLNKQTEKGA